MCKHKPLSAHFLLRCTLFTCDVCETSFDFFNTEYAIYCWKTLIIRRKQTQFWHKAVFSLRRMTLRRRFALYFYRYSFFSILFLLDIHFYLVIDILGVATMMNLLHLKMQLTWYNFFFLCHAGKWKLFWLFQTKDCWPRGYHSSCRHADGWLQNVELSGYQMGPELPQRTLCNHTKGAHSYLLELFYELCNHFVRRLTFSVILCHC